MTLTFSLLIASVVLAFTAGFSLGYALFTWDGGGDDDGNSGTTGGLSHA